MSIKRVGYTEGMGYVYAYSKPIHWHTFEGNIKLVSEIDHQHLSNIYYFINYTTEVPYESFVVNIINKEIIERFDGVVLDYRPLRRFALEMKLLSRKGYLQENGEIIINGELVGKVEEE
jgi:hypothetical protein